MSEQKLAVPVSALVDVSSVLDRGWVWYCLMRTVESDDECGHGFVPSEPEARSAAMIHLATVHGIRQVSITDCIDMDDPAMKERASRICGDMTGPHGVGGECVHLAGHPHEDGIGGEWPMEEAQAIASCPGRELEPNPCRCPCDGCKHHCSAHDPADVEVSPVSDAPAAPEETSDLLAILDRYLAFWEISQDGQGPWPNDPDGGELRIVGALRDVLAKTGHADVEALVRARFKEAQR